MNEWQSEPGVHDAARTKAAARLGVSVDATAGEVQRAFRLAVKEAHPDGGATDSDAFVELHAARETLLNAALSQATMAAARAPRAKADAPLPTPTMSESLGFVSPTDVGRNEPSRVDVSPSGRDATSLFGRGVLVAAVGLGLVMGLLIATAVVAANGSESVRIAPPAEVPEECIIIATGTIEIASCDAPGAVAVAPQSQSSGCEAGTIRLEVPGGDDVCVRSTAQD